MKYEFAEMEIVTFYSEEDNEKHFEGTKVKTLERNPNHIMRTCLIDWNTKIAYNIYTLEEHFPVLEKDHNNFLLPNQDIKMNTKYAIKQREIKINFDTGLEYLYRKKQLKKILEKKKEM